MALGGSFRKVCLPDGYFKKATVDDREVVKNLSPTAADSKRPLRRCLERWRRSRYGDRFLSQPLNEPEPT